MSLRASLDAENEFLADLSDSSLNLIDKWFAEQQDLEMGRLYTRSVKGDDQSFTREISMQGGRIEELKNLRVQLENERRRRDRKESS